MRLRWTVTDLDGTQLGPALLQTTTGEVSISLSDMRTAQNVAISMYDPACEPIEGGSVVLKAEFGELLVFNGVILIPSDDYGTGVLTVSAQDPTLKAQHRNMRYGHATVTASLGGLPGIPIDGSGMRAVLADMDSGGGVIPLSGIQLGTDTVRPQPALIGSTAPPGVAFVGDTTSGSPVVTGIASTTGLVVDQQVSGTGIDAVLYIDSVDSGTQITLSGPVTTGAAGTALAAGDALYVQVTRGQLAWDVWQTMISAASGFDFELNPIDAAHPGVGGWAPGALVELNTSPRQGVDRSQGNTAGNNPVVFVYGKDLSGLVVAPDFSQVKNYAVQVVPGGQTSPTDTGAKAGAFDHASWVKYGLMEDWQSVGDQLDPAIEAAVLKDRALAVAMAYGTPPMFFTATCDTDTPGGLVFGVDYFMGDLITVVGKRGYRRAIVTGRIVGVTIAQRDQNGNATVTVLCVPHHVDPAAISFDA